MNLPGFYFGENVPQLLNYYVPVSGGVVVGGTAPNSFAWTIYPPSGGVTVGGTAPVSEVIIQVYTITPSGGVTVGGTAPVSVVVPITHTITPSGGVTVGGAGVVSDLINWMPIGGVKVGGTAVVSELLVLDFEHVPSGGVQIGGAGIVQEVIPHVPSGGVQVGGAGVVSELLVSVSTITPSGGVTVGGSGVFAFASVVVPSGGVTVGGTAAPVSVFPITSSGGVVVGGSGVYSSVLRFTPSGGVVVSGTAAVSVYSAFHGPSGGVVVGGTALAYMVPSGTTVTVANPYAFPYPGWAINYETFAPSRYLGLPANSMCEFKGVTYVANHGGIYKVDGEDDDGAKIRASLTFPRTDFGTSLEKRLEAAYIGIRTTGVMKLRMAAKDVSAKYKLISSKSDGPKGARVPVGKGLVGRYWDARLDNTKGCAFEVVNAEFVPKRGTRHGA